ncbi:MAG: c-type cytochrome [Gemmatimonadaceae bacterium]|nr:c-type cytochrome [Acetobacteraceae bacterium]
MRAAAAGLLLVAAAMPAMAQDVMAGRAQATRQCAACHGVDGIATLPEAANLAGQDPTYVTRQLAAFRDGTRSNEQMTVVAKALTDTQIANLAAFYAAIRVEVVAVPGR